MRWEGKGNWVPIIFQWLLYKASQLQSLTLGSHRLKNPMWKVKQIGAIMQAQKEFQKEKKKTKSDTWELMQAKSHPKSMQEPELKLQTLSHFD